MKLQRNILGLALLGALFAPAAHAEIVIDNIAGSEVSFEGLIQGDMAWYDSDIANLSASSSDGRKSDYNLRRSEIVLKGKGPGNNEWVLGYDTSSQKWLDVNWKYKLSGNGNHFLQFGQFKQPNSLEELSSTKNNDFVAKSMITNAFGMSRRVGVGYNVGDANWGVNASVFGRELTRNTKQGHGYGVRGYFAPLNDKGNILHLGASYVGYAAEQANVGANTDDLAKFSAKPVDIGNSLVSANIDHADRVSTLGLEGLWVHGPFKLQGEYMRTNVSRNSGFDDYSADGGYVSGLWNITGESWGYKGGTPTTPLPDEPGRGMWQLGLRYDTLDLNDGNPIVVAGVPTGIDGVLGGKINTLTVGVNWYWRSNFKFALDYVKASSNKYNLAAAGNIDDDPSAISARMQFYW